MVKKKLQFFSLIEIIALISSVLIYSGLIKINSRNPFICFFNENKITQIEGEIVSNPVLTTKGSVYTFKINTTGVTSKSDKCDSSGVVMIMCPVKIIEAHYPGKLYSKSGLVLENGVKVKLNVHSMESQTSEMPLFYCDKAEYIGWTSRFAKLRAVFRMQFRRLMFQWGNAGGLLLALLSGSREYTEKKLAEGFKVAGLSHILALSGMHLSFFSGLATKFALKAFGKKFTGLFSLIAIYLFVWFAGLSPSLFRALLCSLIVLISKSLGMKTNILSVLSLAFVIQLFFSPEDSQAISFLLSYGALLGIVTIGVFLEPFFTRFLPTSIAKNVSASCGAQLFTSPICVSFFGCLMPIGVIASVCVSPLISLFLLLGFCFVVLSLVIPPLLVPLGVVMNFVYSVISYFILIFAKVPPVSFG